MSYPTFMNKHVETLFDYIADYRNDALEIEEMEACTKLLEALRALTPKGFDSDQLMKVLSRWQDEDEQERYENMTPAQQKVYNATAQYDRDED